MPIIEKSELEKNKSSKKEEREEKELSIRTAQITEGDHKANWYLIGPIHHE